MEHNQPKKSKPQEKNQDIYVAALCFQAKVPFLWNCGILKLKLDIVSISKEM